MRWFVVCLKSHQVGTDKNVRALSEARFRKSVKSGEVLCALSIKH